MTRDQALALIGDALAKVAGRRHAVTETTDLLEEEMVDSLDGAILLLEIEKAWGGKFPAGDAKDHDLYKVKSLVDFMIANG